MSMLYVLIFPLVILSLTSIMVLLPNVGLGTTTNAGPHGLSEVLYAFTSGAGNNGSAFAGLGPNWWYNITIGWDMLIGRFLMMLPVLALAGNLAQKKKRSALPWHLPCQHSALHRVLVGVVLILGALTFFPALSLGPILEHLQLKSGQLY